MRTIGFVAVLIAGLAPLAPAATLEQMSLDDIIRESTAIVRGRASESRGVQLGGLIFTVTRFVVSEQWKGEPSAHIDIWLPGGQLGSLHQNFGGVPRLQPGLHCVAFLWTGPSGRTQIIGLSQGLFSVEARAGQSFAVRRASADLMLEPVSLRPVQSAAIEMPLESLKSHVESLTAGKR